MCVKLMGLGTPSPANPLLVAFHTTATKQNVVTEFPAADGGKPTRLQGPLGQPPRREGAVVQGHGGKGGGVRRTASEPPKERILLDEFISAFTSYRSKGYAFLQPSLAKPARGALAGNKLSFADKSAQ